MALGCILNGLCCKNTSRSLGCRSVMHNLKSIMIIQICFQHDFVSLLCRSWSHALAMSHISERRFKLSVVLLTGTIKNEKNTPFLRNASTYIKFEENLRSYKFCKLDFLNSALKRKIILVLIL